MKILPTKYSVTWARYLARETTSRRRISGFIEGATFPKTLMLARSFLAASNVYRRFVEDFSKIARLLLEMNRKNAIVD